MNHAYAPRFSRRRKAFGAVLYAVFGLLSFSAQVSATPVNLITNGGFETTVGDGGNSFFLRDNLTSGAQPVQPTLGTGPSDWFLGPRKPSGGISDEILFLASSRDPTTVAGAARRTDGEVLALWGPGNSTPILNGFTLSPQGGNFVALDGDTTVNVPIQQTLSGLTVGLLYNVSWYWAEEQYEELASPTSSTPTGNFTGPTTNRVEVSLNGVPTFTTLPRNNLSQGFNGWFTDGFSFTAASASETISFLAIGSPNGLPPVVLLDGVSVTVPEPGTWASILLGLSVLALFHLRHRGMLGRARPTVGPAIA